VQSAKKRTETAGGTCFLFHALETPAMKKVKQSPHRYWRFQEFEAPSFQDNWHMKVARLSALRTVHPYHQGNIPHFCRLSRSQCYCEAGRIMSIKDSNDKIWNRTRDLLPCSVLPQPTEPPIRPLKIQFYKILIGLTSKTERNHFAMKLDSIFV